MAHRRPARWVYPTRFPVGGDETMRVAAWVVRLASALDAAIISAPGQRPEPPSARS